MLAKTSKTQRCGTLFGLVCQCVALILGLGIDVTMGFSSSKSLGHLQNVIGVNALSSDSELAKRSSRSLCNFRNKENCQSEVLSAEWLTTDSIASENLQNSLHKGPVKLEAQKDFMSFDLYVDQQHRSFNDDIFVQSLELQDSKNGVPIVIEGHCDDRQTNAYSFVLGHTWGMRAKDYFQTLAFRQQSIQLVNYGNETLGCLEDHTECRKDQNRRQSAFRFLAIAKPQLGCLLHVKFKGGVVTRSPTFFEEYSLFLQKIHVAGTKPYLSRQ